jgi:hypothetical protein
MSSSNSPCNLEPITSILRTTYHHKKNTIKIKILERKILPKKIKIEASDYQFFFPSLTVASCLLFHQIAREVRLTQVLISVWPSPGDFVLTSSKYVSQSSR